LLRPKVSDLLRVVTHVLVTDNEENALVCISILFELHKTFRVNDLEKVRPFFEFVRKIYGGLGGSMNMIFGAQGADEGFIPNSVQSFKVLTECPLIVMLLFQLIREPVYEVFKPLLPMMMNAIQIEGPNYNTLSRVHRTRFANLISCQVKTLSFLTFLIRSPQYVDWMRQTEHQIASSVLMLLRTCPPESISDRKDILAATRHILATEFKTGFLNQVSAFLDEGVLLGGAHWMSSSQSPDQRMGGHPLVPDREQPVQPLAYSALADLIHHVRAKLKLSQLSKVIYMFSRNLHDSKLPLTIQATSVRLLLNLVESIFQNDEPEPNTGRQLIVHILHTIVSKFGSLRYYIPQVVKSTNKKAEMDHTVKPMSSYYYTCTSKADDSSEMRRVMLISTDGETEEGTPELLFEDSFIFSSAKVTDKDSLKDLRTLLNTMILGLKTVLWCVCNYGPKRLEKSGGFTKQSRPSGLSGLLNHEELKIVAKLLKWGFQCMPVYREGLSDIDKTTQFDEVEKMNHFAEIFTVLDPHSFADLFRSRMDLVFVNIVRYPAMMAFPKRLLRSKNVAHVYLKLQLEFVVNRLPDLAGDFNLDELVVNIDLSNVFGKKPRKLNFSGVPSGGPNAAASLSGLGLEGEEEQTDVEMEPRTSLPKVVSSKRPRDANDCTSQIVETESPNVAVILGQFVNEKSNRATILSQLIEHIFLCIERYTDETEVGSPPPSVKFSSSKISPSGGTGKNGGISIGWSIACALQGQIEKILVVCFVLSASMTSASHSLLRESVNNPIVSVFRSQESSSRHLVNRPYTKRGLTQVQYNLGRDCYLSTLRAVLRVIARRTVLQEIVKSKVSHLIVPAIRALSQLLRTAAMTDLRTGKESRKDLIAEIVLLFSVRIARNEIHKHLPILQYPLEVALEAINHRNIDLARLALRILESWVDNLESDDLDALFLSSSRGRSSFGHALSELLKPSPHPCGTTALRILGKLGPRARSAILDFMPENQQSISDVLNFEFAWTTHGASNGFSLPIDSVLKSAGSFLRDTFTADLSEYLPYAQDCQGDYIKRPRLSIPQKQRQKAGSAALGSLEQEEIYCTYYKHRAVQLHFAAIAQYFDVPVSATFTVPECDEESAKNVWEFVSKHPSGNTSEQLKPEVAKRSLFLDVLNTVVLMSCDIHTGTYAWSLVEGIIQYLVIAGAGKLTKLKMENPDAHYTFRESWVPLGKGLDVTVVNEVIVHALESSCGVYSKLGLHLIEVVTKTISSALPKEVGEIILYDLLQRLTAGGHMDSWMSRLGSCVGIRYLMTVCSGEWVRENQIQISEVFCFVLELHEDQMGLDVFYHASSGLQELILLCFYNEGENMEMDIADQVNQNPAIQEIVVELLRPFLCTNRNSREFSKICFTLLAKCLNTSLGALFLSLPVVLEDLKKTLFGPRNPKGKGTSIHLIVLDAIGFLFKLEPCPLQFKDDLKPLIQTLADAIMRAEAAEKVDNGELSYAKCLAFAEPVEGTNYTYGNSSKNPGCIFAGPYPFMDIPHEVLIRVAAVEVIEGSFVHGGIPLLQYIHDMDYVKVRDRAVQLVVLSSISAWDSIAKAGQKGLQVVARMSELKLEDQSPAIDTVSLQKCCRIVTSSIDHDTGSINHTMMTPSLLQGVAEYIISFPSDPLVQSGQVVKALISLMTSLFSQSPPVFPVDDIPTLEGYPFIQPKLSYLNLAAEVLKIFFKLPMETVKLSMEVLVNEIVRLESSPERLTLQKVNKSVSDRAPYTASSLELHFIQGHLSSPLKGPLLAVLTRCPTESLEFFLRPEKLRATEWFRLLKSLLVLDEAEVLRKTLISERITSIIASRMLDLSNFATLESAAQREQVLLSFQAVSLISTIVKLEPDWLLNEPKLFWHLMQVWRNSSIFGYITIEAQLPWGSRQYYSQSCEILTRYVSTVQRAIELESDAPEGSLYKNAAVVVFDLLRIVVMRTSMDNAFLHRFYKDVVVLNSTSDFKIAMIRHYIALTRMSDRFSPHIQEAALRLIVIPILSVTDEIFRSTEVFPGSGRTVGDELVMEIVRCVRVSADTSSGDLDNKQAEEYIREFKCDADSSVSPPESVFNATTSSKESLQVELLHLATILIANYGDILKIHRKDLIKFAWNHLKAENSTCKQWAYVNICHFIKVYETPADIILQVYVALLKEHSSDTKHLVKYALDVLVPALSKRLVVDKYVRAIRWAKKMLSDEAHKIPQLLHIWGLVAKHPKLFYQNRNHFMPQMVQSLNRLWTPQAAENRDLTINLAELFLTWEATRASEEAYFRANHKPVSLLQDISHMSPRDIAAENSINGFHASLAMISIVVQFLLRVTLMTGDSRDPLYERCMSLFKTSIEFAGRTVKLPQSKFPIKFSYIQKQVEIASKKQDQRRYEGEKEANKNVDRVQNKSSNDAEKAIELNLKETEPGIICCLIEVISTIIHADPETISKPFILDNASGLCTLINPVFCSSERGSHVAFVELVGSLLNLYPLNIRSRINPLYDPTPGAPKSFFVVVFEEIIRRLDIAADDGKNAIQQVIRPTVAKGVKTSSQSKAAQQKATKAAAQRLAREVGAGPLGTVQTLSLVKALCLRSDKTFDSRILDMFLNSLMKVTMKLMKEVSTASIVRSKNASKTSNAIGGSPTILVSSTRTENQVNYASNALVICLEIAGDRALAHDQHRRNFISCIHTLIDKVDVFDSQVVMKVLELACVWVTAPTHKNEENPSNSLTVKERQLLMLKLEQLERFDGIPRGDEIVCSYLDLVHKVALMHGGESKKKMPWVQEQLNGPLICGLLSPRIQQRQMLFKTYTASFFKGKSPYSKLQLLVQQDWSHMGVRNWIPVAIQFLFSSIQRSSSVSVSGIGNRFELDSTEGVRLPPKVVFSLEELGKLKTSDAILNPIEELCIGDLSGDIGLKTWLQIFPSAWRSLEEHEKMIMTEGLQVLFSRPYHLAKNVTYFTNLQKATVTVSQKLDDISSLIVDRKAALMKDSIASDPFQEACILFAFRRVRAWERMTSVNSPTTLCCILQSLITLKPIPIIAPEILSYAGEMHGAVWEVIGLGELLMENAKYNGTQQFNSIINVKGSRKKQKIAADAMAATAVLKSESDRRNLQRWVESLVYLFSKTNPEFAHGLLREWSSNTVTVGGLGYEACDMWKKAHTVYACAIKRVEAAKGTYVVARRPNELFEFPTMENLRIGEYDDEDDIVTPSDVVWTKAYSTSTTEMKEWLERWKICSHELGNWDQLSKVANENNDTASLIESIYRRGNSSIKQHLLLDQQQFAELQTQNTHDRPYLPLHIFACAVPIRTSLLHVNLGLEESRPQQDLDFLWRQAANIILLEWSSAGNCVYGEDHRSLLFSCQRLAELEEASQYLANIGQFSAVKPVQNTSSKTQASRLLSRWKSRNPLIPEKLSDWDDILISRLHVFALASASLEKNAVKDVKSENYSAFFDSKWTLGERARVYRKHNLYAESLNILDTKLKGDSLVDDEFKLLREKWLSMVPLHSQSSNELREAALIGLKEIVSIDILKYSEEVKSEHMRIRAHYQAFLGNEPEIVHNVYACSVKHDQKNSKAWLDWALYADRLNDPDMHVVCTGSILQAIMHGNEIARTYIPKVLWKLHQERDDNNVAKVSAIIARHIVLLPCWIWIPWIPQLVSFLSQRETSSKIASTLLILVAQEYPNALYYTLRAEYFEKEKQAKSSGVPLEVSHPVKETMQRFHTMHSKMVQELELILEEMLSSFKRQHPLEELLLTIHRLLEKCIAVCETGNQISEIWALLETLCSKLFSANSLSKSPLHASILGGLQTDFETDFHPKNQESRGLLLPEFLTGLMLKIVQWKEKIMNALSLLCPSVVPLFKWSRELASIRPQDLQIPGMHILRDGFSQPCLSNHPQLRGLSDTVSITREDGYSQPLVGFEAENGQTTFYSLRSPNVFNTNSDQLSVQFRVFLNNMLEHTHYTRKKQHLRFAIPVVIPVHHMLTFQYDGESLHSYGQVFETAMSSKGIFSAKAILCAHAANENIVPVDILSKHFMNIASSSCDYQAIRATACKQFALSSLITHLLSCSKRDPSKTRIDSHGLIYDIDFRPQYNATGLLEKDFVVPFRLTRNLQHFLSPIGIDGAVSNSILAATNCFTSPLNVRVLQSYLELYLLMDLETNKPIELDPLVVDNVSSNLDLVMSRLKSLVPQAGNSELSEATEDEMKNQTHLPHQESLFEPSPIDTAVTLLLQQARDPENISKMGCNWMPWF